MIIEHEIVVGKDPHNALTAWIWLRARVRPRASCERLVIRRRRILVVDTVVLDLRGRHRPDVARVGDEHAADMRLEDPRDPGRSACGVPLGRQPRYDVDVLLDFAPQAAVDLFGEARERACVRRRIGVAVLATERDVHPGLGL